MESPPHSRQIAQQAADRIRILRDELSRPEVADVLALTAEQSGRFEEWSRARLEALAAQFDVDTTESQKRMSWGMRIAASLGGLAICAAVVLFFNRYWGYFGTPSQVVVLMLAPLAGLAATEYSARRERTLYFAGLLSLVTLALFVLDLAALGDIFNIVSTENALLAWGALALVLAYRYGLRVMLWCGIAFTVSYCAALLTARLGFRWLEFGDRPEMIALLGVVVFAIPFVSSFANAHRRFSDFPAVYRLAGALIVLISLFDLAEGGAHSYLPLATEKMERVYEVAGLCVAAAAIWAGIVHEWKSIVNCGSIFFTLFLLFRLYHWWWDWMPHYLFCAVIGLIGIGLVAGFRRLRARTNRAEVRA